MEATGWPPGSDVEGEVRPRRTLHVAGSSADQGAKRGGPWAALMRVAFGTHVLALADKAVVSGTSLLSIVLVARWTVPSELDLTLSAVRIRIAARQARATCDIILVRILFAMGRPARAGMENVGPTI